MDDEDLFAVFTERPGVAAAAARQPEGLAATKAPLQIIEYEGFCVDAAPELFDWRAVQSSASVEGWKTVTFLPLIAGPLPLARRTGRLKEDEHRGGAPDSVAEARAGVSAAKKPAGNACFNCGESGHNVQCCPQPRDNDAINKRRKVSAVANSRQNIVPCFPESTCNS